MDRKKVTLLDLYKKKEGRTPITMLTTYDFPSAQAVDRAGIDIAFVGDSYGMVVLGYTSTVPVTMEEMLIACRAVSRGAQYAFLVGDMPFMSYQASVEEAVRNAGRFIKEAGMDGVKLEGGRGVASVTRAINAAGIPVMGHIGLTPQNVTQLSGWRTQGTTAATARALLDDALALEDAGCFAIVLEKVPDRVAQLITERIGIPTIGIGAGPNTSGQVLVLHDLLGYFDRFLPKFAKRYANLHGTIGEAIGRYKAEVETRAFPGPEHVFPINDAEWNALVKSLETPGAAPIRSGADPSADTSSPY
jgi:3-methyl-2-oxobutanoate hydroxymethyltransferase